MSAHDNQNKRLLSIGMILKLGIFFMTAIGLALVNHWVRQSPPMTASVSWPFQMVLALDQAGDLFHALEELPRALQAPDSREAALAFQQAVALRKQAAPVVLADIEMEIQETERKFQIPRLIFRKGVIADLLGDAQQAMQYYQQTIAMKPEMAIAHVQLGLLYERSGQLALAEMNFQKALESHTNELLSHFHYGMFLARATNKRDDALAQAVILEAVRPVYAKMIREKVREHIDPLLTHL